jgi:hypothetical protein
MRSAPISVAGQLVGPRCAVNLGYVPPAPPPRADGTPARRRARAIVLNRQRRRDVRQLDLFMEARP